MATHSRRKWLCQDCGEDTGKIREHYFVHTDLWQKVHPSLVGMLCIGCLEARLGRPLNRADFPPVHINDPHRYAMSDRLRDRLTRTS